MIKPESGDYFAYMPESSLCEAIGCTALSAGYTEIAPGSLYPPVRHPDDHHFVWEKGRTLQAYQFALISSGRGKLEAMPDPGTVHTVEAGDVMLLFPGIWHRFLPDPTIGWTEHWIECRGAAFDRVMAEGLFALEKPIWRGGDTALRLFEQIHALVRQDKLANQPLISGLGLQLLAAFGQSRQPEEMGHRRLVDRAQRILIESQRHDGGIRDLAAELGVSYSTLRRVFREKTGMSLKQYQSEVRIRRACELLRSSDRSIKEIAAHLGFSSTFHFSNQFSQSTGLPPTRWREQNTARASGNRLGSKK